MKGRSGWRSSVRDLLAGEKHDFYYIESLETRRSFTGLYIALKCRYKFLTESHDLVLLLHSSASVRRVARSLPRPSRAGSYSFVARLLFPFFLRHLTSSFISFRSLCHAFAGPMLICTLPLTLS